MPELPEDESANDAVPYDEGDGAPTPVDPEPDEPEDDPSADHTQPTEDN